MTGSTRSPLSPIPSPGVLSEQEGMILQRGGEELAVMKLTDRFTVSLIADRSAVQLAVRLGVQVKRSLASTGLIEFQVAPSQLEQAMRMARRSEDVVFASHVYQIKQSPHTPIFLTNQITIQFADWVEPEQMRSIVSSLRLQVLKLVPGVRKAFVFQVTRQAIVNPIKLANQLMRYPEVLMAEPNIVVQTQPLYRPKDQDYPQQWHLHHEGGDELAAASHISVEAAWDLTRGVRSVVIAIADDGVDLRHPDLQGEGKIVAPIDFDRGELLLPMPENPLTSHGTVCAKLIAAEENGIGIVGVAPGCALMPMRMSEFIDDQAIERLFEWVIEQGAAVASCGWQPCAVYFPLSLRQRAAITRAAMHGREGKGCVIIFAAGNANRPVDGIVNEQGWTDHSLHGETHWLNGFAVHPDVMAIAASTSLNQKAACSNWGKSISVCAPSRNDLPNLTLGEMGDVQTPPMLQHALAGLDVITSETANGFGGTSIASAIVAGVAGLVLSANPELTAAEVRQILQNTADKIIDLNPDPQLGLHYGTYDPKGHSLWFGYGKINALKAVQAAWAQVRPLKIPAYWIDYQNTDPVDIPDGDSQGILTSITVTDARLICAIEIKITIAHSFMGDLEIYLISPQGETMMLQDRSLGRVNRLHTIYSLETTPRLKKLLNQPAIGQWQLKLIDSIPRNTGQLKQWQLRVGV
ncbi:MAG: S8 family serine peptidase [Cyanobacteria bacterium CRU_2_1]|nr:S8 family serine peptidase [Cyanobacteria bacterium RU_5_0]NJR58632.1 S8 family serine peptidase [Cyanobacteria bacterium CRU_2_1]